ncbi:hypothetical protein [Streptomyces mobaraensis]|uniref:Thioesterase domain-containing protein n=1 Tax=Streptomyces mobaraensis TaxID=35621 RepID=A0A5N5W043_STRMB|nr:hypothetical protein [Streptomyces mobaraensis]KAB7833957.1 hypothetical protein FRZ00_31525 [Streptomyces mobaraensis]
MSKNAAHWSRIRTGDAPGVVLAVDFYGTGRQEATFRHLCDLLTDPVEVWHAVPPAPDGDWSTATGAGHLRWWTEGLDTVLAGRPVRALVGYCAGGVFASALADALVEREGHRPRVVLFNPGAPGVATLTRDFHGLIAGMDLLTDGERAALLAETTAIRRAHAPDALVPVAERYAALYREGCDLLCERLGVDASFGAELAAVLHSYLAYLTAALDVPPTPLWRGAVSLTSREHQGTDFTDVEHGFDVARAELLSSPQVVAALTALLREYEASR